MSSFEDQYQLIEKIGEGGMGAVYLAKDTLLDRQVAVKQLHQTSASPEDGNMGDRFQQEALALARLNHPNITHLYAFFARLDMFWMIMEYVEGKTLEGWLRVHKMITYPLAASIAVQILDGLQHAHKRGIIHRDIKPANIMINEEGEVKVMDLGIARMRSSQRITRHGKSVGTLEYMAPEQIRGQEGDERTDVYAVGNIMYEMLCGTPPFRADTDYQVMKDKMEKAPQPIAAYNPSVPAAFRNVISKAMERSPEKRYQTACEFKRAIQYVIGNELLSKQELTDVLKASQVITDMPAGNKPVSIAAILAMATSVRANLKMPAIRKANRPVIFLAASVLLCAVLLIWNIPDKPDEETGREGIVAGPLHAVEPAHVVATTSSLEETPGEMYERISQQNHANTIQRPNVKKEIAVRKITPDRKTSMGKKEEEKGMDAGVDYKKENTPVDVPAGRVVQVTLSENLSSEDKSRDGGVLHFSCAENIEAGGRIIIKKGATVTGKVVDVVPTGDGRRKALVGFVIQKVQAADGSFVKLKSRRYRLFADAPDEPVTYKRGTSFTAELGRGRVR